jgi:hypothetical protein
LLYVGGVPLPVAGESWRERRIPIGDVRDKSLAGRPAVSRGPTLREWSFRTPRDFALTKAERLAWIKWIEGHGQKWSFDSASHSYSAAGVTNSAIASITRSAAGGWKGGHIEVASTSVFGVDMSNKLHRRRGWLPTNGWTLHAYRNFVAAETASAGWHSCFLEGAVSFTRGASANPAGVNQYVDAVLNNSANLGRVFSVSSTSPYCGVHGYNTNNAGAAIDYDEFMFVPFQMPAAWIASIKSELFDDAVGLPNLPRQLIHGDWFEQDSALGGVEVIGYVNNVDQRIGRPGGASSVDMSMAELTVTFEEW